MPATKSPMKRLSAEGQRAFRLMQRRKASWRTAVAALEPIEKVIIVDWQIADCADQKREVEKAIGKLPAGHPDRRALEADRENLGTVIRGARADLDALKGGANDGR